MDLDDIFREIEQVLSGGHDSGPKSNNPRDRHIIIPPHIQEIISRNTAEKADTYQPPTIVRACQKHPQLAVVPWGETSLDRSILICLVDPEVEWIRQRPKERQPSLLAEYSPAKFALKGNLSLEWRAVNCIDNGYVIQPMFREFDELIRQEPASQLPRLESRVAIALDLHEFYVSA